MLRLGSGLGCSRYSKSGRIEGEDEDVDDSSGTSVLGGANDGGANDRVDDNQGRDNAACSSSDGAADAGMIDLEGVDVEVGLGSGTMFVHEDASDVVGNRESKVGGVIKGKVDTCLGKDLGLGLTAWHEVANR